MGAIVVVLFAVAIMLALAVVVAIVRLLGAWRHLRTAVDSTRQWLQPAISELTAAGQLTSLELAQLQASVSDLGSEREQVERHHHPASHLSDEAEGPAAAPLH